MPCKSKLKKKRKKFNILPKEAFMETEPKSKVEKLKELLGTRAVYWYGWTRPESYGRTSVLTAKIKAKSKKKIRKRRKKS